MILPKAERERVVRSREEERKARLRREESLILNQEINVLSKNIQEMEGDKETYPDKESGLIWDSYKFVLHKGPLSEGWRELHKRPTLVEAIVGPVIQKYGWKIKKITHRNNFIYEPYIVVYVKEA